jgi:hypothetical protein
MRYVPPSRIEPLSDFYRSGTCTCTHGRGDHEPFLGPCTECGCKAFELKPKKEKAA